MHITAAPLILLERQTRSVSLGSTVTLLCETRGTPLPAITWSKRAGRLPR